MKYEIILYWSEADGAYIAEVPELAGCTQPPHVQAKKAYRKYSKNSDGSSKTLLITSEYRGKTNPKPLRFKIDCTGIREDTGFDAAFIHIPAPRAGF